MLTAKPLGSGMDRCNQHTHGALRSTESRPASAHLLRRQTDAQSRCSLCGSRQVACKVAAAVAEAFKQTGWGSRDATDDGPYEVDMQFLFGAGGRQRPPWRQSQ